MSHINIIFINLLTVTVQNVLLTFSSETQKKIVNGREVDISLVPYTVSIFEQDEYICVGSYILPRWVLTAAHCIESHLPDNIHVINSNKLLLKMGSAYRRDNNAQVRRSVVLVAHEEYVYSVHAFDIAIINLSEKFALNEKVALIPLVTKEIYDRILRNSPPVMVAGWGFTAYLGNGYSDVIQAVKIKLILKDNCQRMYETDTISDDSICAGNTTDGGDACHGDSGAALVLEDPVVQIGLVSWGIGCGASFPGVYTNVYYHKDWINNRSETYANNDSVKHRLNRENFCYILSLIVLNII